VAAECPKCHAENRDDSKYCGNCAAPLGPGAASQTKTPEPPVRVLKPGTLIAGKYRIAGEVGAGAMGVVCKGEDPKLKRTAGSLPFGPPRATESPRM
jgi:hypothetical protein